MNLSSAYTLAAELVAKHGLWQWRVEWDKAIRRMGCCHYRTRTITLSRELFAANDEPECKDTILHEIAHALVPTDSGHGWVWKHKAREIGARPIRCYSAQTVNMISNGWRGICPACKDEKQITAVRKPDYMVCNCWRTAQAAWKANPDPKVGININRHTYNWIPTGRVIIPAKNKFVPVGTVPNAREAVLLVKAASACTAAAPAPVAAEWVNLGPVTNVEVTLAPFAPLFDAKRAVELYQAGGKVVDIAVAMGYKRGQGQNRTRTALIKAGVYKQ